MMAGETYIVDAVRTPTGRYGGALAGVRPDDLAALCIGVGQAIAMVVEADGAK